MRQRDGGGEGDSRGWGGTKEVACRRGAEV